MTDYQRRCREAAKRICTLANWGTVDEISELIAARTKAPELAEALRAVVLTADSAVESGLTEAECVAGNWDILGPRLRALLARLEDKADA